MIPGISGSVIGERRAGRQSGVRDLCGLHPKRHSTSTCKWKQSTTSTDTKLLVIASFQTCEQRCQEIPVLPASPNPSPPGRRRRRLLRSLTQPCLHPGHPTIYNYDKKWHVHFLLASNWKQARAIRRCRIVVVSQLNRNCNHSITIY